MLLDQGLTVTTSPNLNYSKYNHTGGLSLNIWIYEWENTNIQSRTLEKIILIQDL